MKRNRFTIALSSAAGDPCLEKTWSGTPYNLLKSLEELDVSVVPIDSSLARPVRAACRLTQRLMGFKGHTVRGPVARWFAARRTERRCHQAGVRSVLHTGSLDLPGTSRGQGLERYLYCDSTWNLSSQYSMDVRHFSARSNQFSEELEKKAYAQTRRVFSISHYVKDNLILHYRVNPETITVVGSGRGKITPFHGSKDYARGPVLFVAKDRFEEKGGALLLAGFRLVSQRNPAPKLVLAGKGVESVGVRDMANVTVAGHVSWGELQRLFETASLFAMPAYNEPWGLVFLEALACKTPLLGLARNSLPELTQGGSFGFLVHKSDPQTLAEAILEATADPKRLERMGLAGQEYCLNTFSWKQTAVAILGRMMAAPLAAIS
jgi:glycosyltransferase involved in cell wall biosynthesis